MVTLHFYIALSTWAIYVCGSVLHILIIVGIVLKVSEWRKNSGILTIISLAVSDLMTCLPYVFGCTESVINIQLLTDYSNCFVGYFNHLSWVASSFHMLTMAANRFVAIVFPTKFASWCGPRYTLIYIAISWTLTVCYCTTYAFLCSPLIYSRDFVLVVYDTPTSEANCNTEFGITAAAISGPAFLYSATVLKLLIYGKQMRANGQNFSVDMRLCWQFAIILVFYITLEVSWYFIPQIAAYYDNFDLYYAICYAIALNFTFNPVVYLTFNSTIRKSNRVNNVFTVNVRSSHRDEN